LEKATRQRRYANQVRALASAGMKTRPKNGTATPGSVDNHHGSSSRPQSATGAGSMIAPSNHSAGGTRVAAEAAVRRLKMLHYASQIKRPTQFLPFPNARNPAITLPRGPGARLPPLNGRDDGRDIGDRSCSVSPELRRMEEEHARAVEVVEGIKKELRMI
ncbi:hypothetical protein HK101_004103, partial [Irineochytrium annulatum]